MGEKPLGDYRCCD